VLPTFCIGLISLLRVPDATQRPATLHEVTQDAKRRNKSSTTSLWPHSLTMICSLCPLPIPSYRTFTFTSLYPSTSTSSSSCNRPEPRHTPRFRSKSEKPSSSASAHAHFLLTRPMADHLDLELNVDPGTYVASASIRTIPSSSRLFLLLHL
jgi:hypothetical protein